MDNILQLKWVSYFFLGRTLQCQGKEKINIIRFEFGLGTRECYITM